MIPARTRQDAALRGFLTIVASECVRLIYAKHSAGCCWHVVLDDGNCEKSCVDLCAKEATSSDCCVTEGACAALSAISGALTKTQWKKIAKRKP